MKLAFYYHIPVVPQSGKLYLPGYLGVFVDSLANAVEELYLVMHEARSHEKAEADYALKSPNIRFISLGEKTPAWHRGIFHKNVLSEPLKQMETCDYFLVRSPSPLAPYFHKYIKHPKLVFMVVGDYAESVAQIASKSFRDVVINQYLKHNDYLFRKRMRYTDLFVNSPALFDKYKPISKSIHQIKTTTLSKSDFYYREDTCEKPQINLLYTGRIDPLKGLFELVEATAVLRKQYPGITLHMVGWENTLEKPVEAALKQAAEKMGIAAHVIFHGKKTIGEELNAMYRMADVYIIPSYEEGFPRTIWEAMANSLPVVATTVGAIPRYLRNNEDALLIAPKKTEEITTAIQRVLSEPALRRNLIANGMKLAENNTLEYQANNMIQLLKQL